MNNTSNSTSYITWIMLASSACMVFLSAGGMVAYLFHMGPFDEKKVHTLDTSMYASATTTGVFPTVVLQGKAAIVYDLATKKKLYSKNDEGQFPLASLTKLMTAYVASNVLPETATVAISADALESEGDSGFNEGETWRFKDLLGLTLMESSNDGARAIATAAGAALNGKPGSENSNDRKTFIEKMNTTSKMLGLSRTYFMNETGLDNSPDVSGAYGSAHDIAIILGKLFEASSLPFEDTGALTNTFTSLLGKTYTAENTNQHIGNIPGLIASKTGYTDLAGGNLAVLFDAGVNHPIAVVVLGSTREGRFKDAEALVHATIDFFTQPAPLEQVQK